MIITCVCKKSTGKSATVQAPTPAFHSLPSMLKHHDETGALVMIELVAEGLYSVVAECWLAQKQAT